MKSKNSCRLLTDCKKSIKNEVPKMEVEKWNSIREKFFGSAFAQKNPAQVMYHLPAQLPAIVEISPAEGTIFSRLFQL